MPAPPYVDLRPTYLAVSSTWVPTAIVYLLVADVEGSPAVKALRVKDGHDRAEHGGSTGTGTTTATIKQSKATVENAEGKLKRTAAAARRSI